MRKRKVRAARIVRVLHTMDSANATELRDTAHGWVTITAQAMEMSKATASHDFALVRRMHRQLPECLGAISIPRETRLFGRGTGTSQEPHSPNCRGLYYNSTHNLAGAGSLGLVVRETQRTALTVKNWTIRGDDFQLSRFGRFLQM